MHPLLVAALLFLALACVLWVLWRLRPRRMTSVYEPGLGRREFLERECCELSDEEFFRRIDAIDPESFARMAADRPREALAFLGILTRADAQEIYDSIPDNKGPLTMTEVALRDADAMLARSRRVETKENGTLFVGPISPPSFMPFDHPTTIDYREPPRSDEAPTRCADEQSTVGGLRPHHPTEHGEPSGDHDSGSDSGSSGED